MDSGCHLSRPANTPEVTIVKLSVYDEAYKIENLALDATAHPSPRLGGKHQLGKRRNSPVYGKI